ncbi:MAG: DUF1122 family protein, partial [Candidatus Geothermarchaeales archaeon]
QILLESRAGHYREHELFKIWLVDGDGLSSSHPVFEGIHSSGRPSQHIEGWMDGDYYEALAFGRRKVVLSDSGLDKALFEQLGRLIPSGGSLMVSYSMFWGEGRVHRDTRLGLDIGVPPVATPLGSLLFEAGCGLHVRDWYIPEGGREGPPKLQGHKPIDEEEGLRWRERLRGELELFLKTQKGSGDEVREDARSRASRFLKSLQGA